MTYERIVAVYDKAGKARDAARALEASGFPAGDISVMHRDTMNLGDLREPKLRNKLFGRELSDHESALFTRTIEGGGGVLTLRAPDTDMPRAMKILDVRESVETRDRAEMLRSGDGYDRSDVGSRANRDDRTDLSARADAAANSGVPLTRTSAIPPTGTTTPVPTDRGREEVIRLHEEQLDVGKRVVETGKARVRRFVVEKPVESQVKLHEEHATIQRRPITNGEAIKDADWSDKVIEITETAEQPVVTKKVRVADEVVIRREGSDRVETVHDTVRRQEVDLVHPGRDRDIRDRDIKRAA